MKNNNIRGMKKNISLWKKIKLFNSYKKIVKDSKKELESKFNLRIDGAHRMYTVLNIPEELIGEEYSLRKSDIDKISENFITEYGMELKKFLDTKGLTELYEYYEIKKVDKYSYLLVYGFSQFQRNKYYNNLYWKVIPASVITITSLLFFLFL
jgi:hypothetical protein